jgi:Sec-independent protein secretion pathway component TatC
MTTNEKIVNMEDMKAKLSTLWIVVMFNMVFADILSFMLPDFLEILQTGQAGGVPITQEILLVFAVFLEIPIVMIILSRVLKVSVNRWANIIAAVITILFVVGGGSTSLHYIFFATIEVACMLLIIWYAWRWPNPET